MLALAGIVLLSLGMRSATSAFSPLFGEIDGELHLGAVVLGVIGAVPLLAFSVSGFVAPRIARLWGLELTLIAALSAIVLGQAGRALAVEPIGVVAGTVVTMLGIGVANVLMPPVVKRYFPDRIGLVTAIYLTLFGVGAASPGFFAVPISGAIGWRPTLAVWGVTVLLALIPWMVLARRPRVATGPIEIVVPDGGPRPRRTSRDPVAWALVLVMIASASGGYNAAAWLPTILHDMVGLTAAESGIQSGILFAMGIPLALIVPLIGSRPRPAAVIVVIAIVTGVLGWGGLVLAPHAPTVLWSVLIGLSAITFPLVLTQIAVRSATPRAAARLSGFVQGFAYVTTAVLVFSIGVLHTLTGGWTAPVIVIAIVAALPAPAIVILARRPRAVDAAQ